MYPDKTTIDSRYTELTSLIRERRKAPRLTAACLTPVVALFEGNPPPSSTFEGPVIEAVDVQFLGVINDRALEIASIASRRVLQVGMEKSIVLHGG